MVALLLCHGAFVSLHHPVPDSPGAGHSAHTAASAETTPEAGEQPSVGKGHVAALIFMLGVALGFLGLWLAGSRQGRTVRVVRPPITEALPSCIPYPVRAPALASLQVFRL